ncbi:hypothetical protein BGZ83_008633 [Gryganskiella cystojenkinii]|nr:hypothetical protein BGZ83_008633 [Gryganskiella cystojenkinii]
MVKSLLLVALCASFAVAQWAEVTVYNNAGRSNDLTCLWQNRYCFCVSNTQTNRILNKNGGTVKIFSSTDCTGNYDTLALGKTLSNAQWVNSISIGKAGIASQGPDGCYNYFP